MQQCWGLSVEAVLTAGRTAARLGHRPGADLLLSPLCWSDLLILHHFSNPTDPGWWLIHVPFFALWVACLLSRLPVASLLSCEPHRVLAESRGVPGLLSLAAHLAECRQESRTGEGSLSSNLFIWQRTNTGVLQHP